MSNDDDDGGVSDVDDGGGGDALRTTFPSQNRNDA